MKTKIFTLLIAVMGVMTAMSAFAQPTVVTDTSSRTAKDGSTVSYSITGVSGATYYWALSGGSSTNNVSTISGTVDGDEVSITWDAATAGTTYNLDVYLVDPNLCYSELYRFEVTIESVVLSITDASAITCSWLGTDDDSGNTVSANDQFIFDLSTDAAGTATPITVNYSITGGTGTDTRTNNNVAIVSEAGELVVDIDSYFGNTSGSNVTFTITITSATDADSNPLAIGASDEATITVHSVPVISF